MKRLLESIPMSETPESGSPDPPIHNWNRAVILNNIRVVEQTSIMANLSKMADVSLSAIWEQHHLSHAALHLKWAEFAAMIVSYEDFILHFG